MKCEELSDIWSKIYVGLHVNYPLFLPGFHETWIFSTDIRKIISISNFMKVRPVGAQLFHADRHAGANNRFSQFCELAPKPRVHKIRRKVAVEIFFLIQWRLLQYANWFTSLFVAPRIFRYLTGSFKICGFLTKTSCTLRHRYRLRGQCLQFQTFLILIIRISITL